jgi:hypothetical protein
MSKEPWHAWASDQALGGDDLVVLRPTILLLLAAIMCRISWWLIVHISMESLVPSKEPYRCASGDGKFERKVEYI